MKYRALVSFTGTISMAGGEVRDISDPAISANLLKCGYIEPMEKKSEKIAEKATETEEVEKVAEKKKSPRRKKDGN